MLLCDTLHIKHAAKVGLAEAMRCLAAQKYYVRSINQSINSHVVSLGLIRGDNNSVSSENAEVESNKAQCCFAPGKRSKLCSQRTTCMHLTAQEILAQHIKQVATGLCLVQPEAENRLVSVQQRARACG